MIIDSTEAADLRAHGKMRRAVNVEDLRIILRHRVDSDALPGDIGESAICAPPRVPLAITLNPYGAVSAIVDAAGTRLGIKPREFDFVCPFAALADAAAADVAAQLGAVP